MLGDVFSNKTTAIGGIYDASEGKWRWTTGEPWVFTRWGGGEPSNPGVENALEITPRSDSPWNDTFLQEPVMQYLLEFGGPSDPNNPDTDGDGLTDFEDVRTYKTFPDVFDSDSDGLSDGVEIAYKTNPLKRDTDGDGFPDGVEISAGTNPLQPDSTPSGLRVGLVSIYPFDGTGSDVSGNLRHANIKSATFSEDRFGQSNSAATFDGLSGAMQASLPPELSGNAPRTICFWMKPNDDRNISGIVHQGKNDCNGLMFGIGRDFGRILFWGGCKDYLSTLAAPAGQWSFVAATFEGSRVKLFLNDSQDSVNIGALNTQPSSLHIGAETLDDGAGYRKRYNGSIDDVSVYNRALSDSEVNAIYSRAALRTGRKAASGYRFTVQGVPDRKFDIETSSTLQNWAPTFTNLIATNFATVFTDVSATNREFMFYRIRQYPSGVSTNSSGNPGEATDDLSGLPSSLSGKRIQFTSADGQEVLTFNSDTSVTSNVTSVTGSYTWVLNLDARSRTIRASFPNGDQYTLTLTVAAGSTNAGNFSGTEFYENATHTVNGPFSFQ